MKNTKLGGIKVMAFTVLVGVLLLSTLVLAARNKGGGSGGSLSACNDHIDNDGDGFCDYSWARAYCIDGSQPGDSDCSSKNDDTEAPPQVCGNGVIEGSEVCDGSALNGASCVSEGFVGGTLGCLADCSGYDVSSCVTSICGNGIVEGAEVCDSADLAGESCLTQGFSQGVLSCDTSCASFDTSGCTSNFCIDSDGGLDISTFGTVNATYNNTNVFRSDSCAGSVLTEHYCSSTIPLSFTLDCALNGTVCLNGACV